MTNAISEGRATARDGTPIAWRLHTGPAGGGRVVLVHSLAMDRRFWDPVAALVSAQASVLAIDCRGHGQSGKPAGPYTAEGFADDVADAMTAVGWPSAVIAGASMGGSVAIQFAGTHAARTQALGLFDTTAWYGEKAPEEWAARAQRARDSGLADLVDFQLTRWFSDGFRAAQPALVQACVDTFLANDIGGYAASCHLLGTFDGRRLLPGIRVPTAILVGEEDYATPVAMGQQLHAGIAGSTFAVIPGARHLTPLEVPERIAAALAELHQRRGAQP